MRTTIKFWSAIAIIVACSTGGNDATHNTAYTCVDSNMTYLPTTDICYKMISNNQKSYIAAREHCQTRFTNGDLILIDHVPALFNHIGMNSGITGSWRVDGIQVENTQVWFDRNSKVFLPSDLNPEMTRANEGSVTIRFVNMRYATNIREQNNARFICQGETLQEPIEHTTKKMM